MISMQIFATASFGISWKRTLQTAFQMLSFWCISGRVWILSDCIENTDRVHQAGNGIE